MRIVYPFPMHISHGYNYMLSISQFVNALAKYCPVDLLCLDSKEEVDHFFSDTLGDRMTPDLNIITISNKILGIKSNTLFFQNAAKKHIRNLADQDGEVLVYSRNLKHTALLISSLRDDKRVKFAFEPHQILSQNLCRDSKFKDAERTRKLERDVLENVDFLIPITKTLNNEIDLIFNGVTKNRTVLPVGVANKFFIKKISPSEYDLIYSGNFSEWKGIDILLDSLALACKIRPNLSVIFTGAYPEQKLHYEKNITQLGLDHNINFIDRTPHKEMPIIMQKANIGVVSASYKGDGLLYTSPLKLYEYLASGLTVVAPRIPSLMSMIPEHLIHWAIPEDANSLSRAILSSLGGAGQIPVSDGVEYARKFTWAKRAEALVDQLKL